MAEQSNPAPVTVPDHELLQPIGRGSYGEVWLARNILGTFRAVKIVRRDSFSNARPFEREFAGIQHIEPLSRGHEGLVDILQVGRGESDGFFYYVMELADPAPGTEVVPVTKTARPYSPRSLASDLTTRGRLSVAECIHLFHSVALALAHLHRAGLVHRDIKPSNIIFVGGVPKLADIGLVAAADDAPSYVGTEGFIPPEGAGTMGADIYSLGKVLYEAGTGRDRSDFPALPADAADLEASDGLMELNAIWLKASATAPADRYQSMDEMAADLAMLRAGRSVKRMRVVEGRLRRARQFAGGVGVLAMVIAIGWWVSKREADAERLSRKTADILRNRAVQAEHEARELLSEARVAQIRAVLQSQQIGRRAVALALLTNQISAPDRVPARSLAAMALALPDLVPVREPAAEPREGAPAIAPQSDGSIMVRQPSGGSRTIPSQGERVRLPLELSGDGRYLYAGYGARTERIWDLSDGREVARLDTNYYRLAFRPGHAGVAVAYVNGDLILHRLPGWESDQVWDQASGGPLQWNPDGSQLLAVGAGNHVRLLDAVTGKSKALGDINSPVGKTAWHPDGSHVLLAADDGYVRVQDINARPEYVLLGRHEAQVIDAVFLPPFPWLLSSSWDGTSRLWDWQTDQELGRLEATGYDLKYDPTNRLLHWRLGVEPVSRAWQLTGGGVWRQFFYANAGDDGGPFMAGFSGDSQWMVTPDTDGIRIWHIATGVEALFLPVYAQSAWLNSEGTELLANGNSAIRRWRLTPADDHKLQATETKDLGPSVYQGKLAVSTNGSVIAWIAGSDLKVIYQGASNSWPHGQELAEVIAVSPNGRFVAVGTRNHLGAKVFDAADGRLLWQTTIGHGTHLSFSADSQWLAVGTDKGCYVFAANSGALRWRRVPGPGEEPSFWETAFSPDGAFVAWTPKPSQVQILNATDGGELLTLDYPTRRYITGLAFSPDGRWLAETCNKHSVHLWDLRELRRQLDDFGLGW